MQNDLEYIEKDDMYLEFSESLVPKPLLHKCADGKIFCLNYTFPKYPKITDSHLLNILAYIERNAIKYAKENQGKIDENTLVDMYSFASSLQGDMASYYAEQMCDNYENNGKTYHECLSEFLATVSYNKYLEEAKKRKLEYISIIDWDIEE